jgi:hypothetical protein
MYSKYMSLLGGNHIKSGFPADVKQVADEADESGRKSHDINKNKQVLLNAYLEFKKKRTRKCIFPFPPRS